jgi:hypothetical protein
MASQTQMKPMLSDWQPKRRSISIFGPVLLMAIAPRL